MKRLWEQFIQKTRLRREKTKSIPLRTKEEQKQEAKQIAKAFAIVAFICGLIITFILPPLCAPDENVHFVNVYAMSTGDIIADEYEGVLVRWIPKYYNEYINTFPINLNGLNNLNRYSYHEMYRDSYEGLTEEDNTLYPFETSITSTGYIISAVSMKLGRVLGQLMDMKESVFPYNQMLFGRLGNLLFYVIIAYFAIKRAPHFNKTMALIALMPMSIFLGASLSYDAILIPVSLYFFALIMDLCVEPEKKISSADIIRVILCVFTLSGMKFGAYIPLFAVLLAVPKSKYGNIKRMILCIIGVACAAFIGYLPTIIIGARAGKLELASGVVTNAVLQKQWISNNLLSLPQLYLTTFDMRHGVYLSSFWGEIGWLDTFFPSPIVIFGYIVLGIVSVSEICTYTIWEKKRWKNLLPAIGSLVSMFGVMLGMLINFTPLGSVCIEGVQGRYFIPLFVGFALAMSNSSLYHLSLFRNGKAGRSMTKLTLLWGSCCAIMTVIILLLRYRIN